MDTTSHTFPASHRIRTKREFSAVFDARVRQTQGPLALLGLPNNLNHPRLGIVISRQVGIAVRRNRIKRLLRESFRLLRHELPGAYDLIVVVRPHAPLKLPDYQRMLMSLATRIHERWSKQCAGS